MRCHQLFTILLCVLLSIVLLSACGKQAAEEPVTTQWTTEGTQPTTEATQPTTEATQPITEATQPETEPENTIEDELPLVTVPQNTSTTEVTTGPTEPVQETKPSEPVRETKPSEPPKETQPPEVSEPIQPTQPTETEPTLPEITGPTESPGLDEDELPPIPVF